MKKKKVKRKEISIAQEEVGGMEKVRREGRDHLLLPLFALVHVGERGREDCTKEENSRRKK